MCIDIKSECWNFTGALNKDGYGILKVDGTHKRVHRISYEYYIGEIEEGMVICHTCDNPRCFNPKHLFKGTQKDNVQDMVSKNRNSVSYGDSSARHKLSEAQIKAIREDPRIQRDIAKSYNLSKSHVSMILNYKTRLKG